MSEKDRYHSRFSYKYNNRCLGCLLIFEKRCRFFEGSYIKICCGKIEVTIKVAVCWYLVHRQMRVCSYSALISARANELLTENFIKKE